VFVTTMRSAGMPAIVCMWMAPSAGDLRYSMAPPYLQNGLWGLERARDEVWLAMSTRGTSNPCNWRRETISKTFPLGAQLIRVVAALVADAMILFASKRPNRQPDSEGCAAAHSSHTATSGNI
jgi:hypothetical protein